MRTRRSETIERAKNLAQTRKRKDSDSAVGDAGDRSKRCKTQFCTEAVQSPLKKKLPNSADRERAAEGLKNGDDEVFAMTLEKFVGALRTRGAADRSSRNATGHRSRASLKKSITQNHGTAVSPVLIQPGQSCDHTHTVDDHHGRDNEKSKEEGAMDECSSRLLLHTGVKHSCRNNIAPPQGGSIEQCSSGFGRNVHTLGASTHYSEDGIQIIDTSPSPWEVAGVQCQLHEDGPHNVADTTLVKGKTEKWLRHKKRGASLCEESLQGEQNGSHATLFKRRLEEPLLSCPRSDKSKRRPGIMKQFKNQRKATLTEVSQQLNSSHLRKRLNAAKSRWKNLAQSILSTKISPEILASASEDLTRSVANTKNYKATPLRKKQRKLLTAANASAADQRPLTGRMRQKVHMKQLGLLKRMKTWLNEAKFSQVTKDEYSNDIGEEFIMTEDERYAFAKSMVQSCQKKPNMRTVFLESVRMLTLSGLMQAAASNLLRQGPCEEAQNVMNAWTDFKEKSAITKTLPMNLLSSVDQLHEKRGDLSTKLSMPNIVGICSLSQIDEKTWKFQLPVSPPEDSRSSEQDNAI